MIRKTIFSAAATVALMLGLLATPASADPTATPTPVTTPPVCNTVGYNNCVAYPSGGFGNASSGGTPTATPTPRPFATATPVNETTTATGGGAGAATIAFTGAESRVLGYVGAGMIGFGAGALAAARRKNESDLS